MLGKGSKTGIAKNSNATIIYVTRDIERASALDLGHHFIITNKTAYALDIQRKYPRHVFLIENVKNGERELLDTYELLSHPETEKIKKDLARSVLVFKNTSRIESFCEEKKWHLLNPSAELAEKIENKISQVAWLGNMGKYLPPHQILKISDINTSKIQKPFVIQWAHGHTGFGTIFVPADKKGSKSPLDEIQKKFPEREARVTQFIKGPMFTVNISTNNITRLIGNISYQITGTLPFTDNSFATIGNDWSLPHTILSEVHIEKVFEIGNAVAERMRDSGWRGLFGIDCIYDEERDMMHLIEVNARQPASASYESILQEKVRALGVSGQTIFEAHIDALLGDQVGTQTGNQTKKTDKIIGINDGAQIIERIQARSANTEAITNSKAIIEKLREKNYTVIEYENIKLGSDHIRIQSEHGIMEAHNKFNSRGKEILEIVTDHVSM